MAIVYKHIRKDNGEIFYIGIGKTKRRITSDSGRNKYWHNIVNKVGYDWEIIKSNITWKEACIIEQELIKKYGRKDLGEGNLVNMTEGGEGFTSNHTDMTKLIMSEKKTGKNHWIYGKHHTKESKNKISKSHLGKVVSEESKEKNKQSHMGKKVSEKTKKKMSKSHLGKVVGEETKKKISLALTGRPKSKKHIESMRNRIITDETRKKMRDSHLGQVSWNKGGIVTNQVREKISNSLKGNTNAKTIKVIQYDLNGNFVKEWSKLIDIKNELGFGIGNISSCINKKRKTAYGFIWKKLRN